MKSHLLDYILNTGSHPCSVSFFFLDQVANFKVLLDGIFSTQELMNIGEQR